MSVYEDLEAVAVGSLPANYQNGCSPAGGTVGNAAVTSTNPIRGSRSLEFAAPADGMTVWTTGAANLPGLVFLSRLNLSGANICNAGAFLQTDGTAGYLVFPDQGGNQLVCLKGPTFSEVARANSGTLGAALGPGGAKDLQPVWMRAEFLKSLGMIRARIWPDGTAEPTDWPLSGTDGANPYLTAPGQGFRAEVSFAGRPIDLDNIQFYDPAALVSGVPYLASVGNDSANLYAPGAAGGVGPYTYQWQRSTGSGFADVAGATSPILADSGLASGTAYSYRIVVTDTGNGNATAASPVVQVMTTGVVPPHSPTISISSDGSVDTITVPAPSAGDFPIGSAWLFLGTAAGAESTSAASTMSGPGPWTFTHATATSGAYYYTVRAADTQSPANVSLPSNEVFAIAPAAPSSGGGATPGQITAIVQNNNSLLSAAILAAVNGILTPARLAVLDAISAGANASNTSASQGWTNFFAEENAQSVGPSILAQLVAAYVQSLGTSIGMTTVPANSVAGSIQAAGSIVVPTVGQIAAQVLQVLHGDPLFKAALAFTGGTYQYAPSATAPASAFFTNKAQADAASTSTYVVLLDRSGVEITRWPYSGRTSQVLPSVGVGA